MALKILLIGPKVGWNSRFHIHCNGYQGCYMRKEKDCSENINSLQLLIQNHSQSEGCSHRKRYCKHGIIHRIFQGNDKGFILKKPCKILQPNKFHWICRIHSITLSPIEQTIGIRVNSKNPTKFGKRNVYAVTRFFTFLFDISLRCKTAPPSFYFRESPLNRNSEDFISSRASFFFISSAILSHAQPFCKSVINRICTQHNQIMLFRNNLLQCTCLRNHLTL